jgi:hypothetical protein
VRLPVQIQPISGRGRLPPWRHGFPVRPAARSGRSAAAAAPVGPVSPSGTSSSSKKGAVCKIAAARGNC